MCPVNRLVSKQVTVGNSKKNNITTKFTPRAENVPSFHNAVGYISFLSFTETRRKTNDYELNGIKHVLALFCCQHLSACNFYTLVVFSNV